MLGLFLQGAGAGVGARSHGLGVCRRFGHRGVGLLAGGLHQPRRFRFRFGEKPFGVGLCRPDHARRLGVCRAHDLLGVLRDLAGTSQIIGQGRTDLVDEHVKLFVVESEPAEDRLRFFEQGF
jgi:hypothetical protein